VQIEVRRATQDDAALVAEMAVALTDEISETLGEKQFDVELPRTTILCRELLAEGRYLALLAYADGECVGFVGISDGRALYANGKLATLEEFYVSPSFRKHGVGTALVEAAVELSGHFGWKRLEVCTPPLPEFARSLEFYQQNDFVITGGRKLRRIT